MKLPNWLHRKPHTLTIDEFFGGPMPALDFEPDPYLNSLAKGQYEAELDKPGHVPGEYASPYQGSLAQLADKAKAFEAARLENAVAIANAKGYWEGRAESDAAAANPEYSVEVVRNDADFIDEVLLHDATRCLFHLERIADDHWWITLNPTGGWDEETLLDIFRVKKCIEVTEQ